MAEVNPNSILLTAFKSVTRLFRAAPQPQALRDAESGNVSRATARDSILSPLDGRYLALTYDQMLMNAQVFSSLKALVSSAFQPFDGGGVIRVTSKYPEVESELTEFFASLKLDVLVPKLSFDLLHHGNLTVKHHFNDKGELDSIETLPKWNAVIPFVHREEILYYQDADQTKSKVMPPWDFSFTQLVTLSKYGRLSLANLIDNKTRDVVENQFIPAESYLRRAVEPWRRVEITLMSLVSARIDSLNYKRIMFLPTSGVVNSKTSTEYIKFYSGLFTGARSRALGEGGLTNHVADFGGMHEMVIPYKSDLAKPEIQDIQSRAGDKVAEDLKEHEKQLAMALQVPMQYAGYDLEGAPGSLGESPVDKLDAMFGRAAKEVQSRILTLFKNISYIRLLSRGYEVTLADFDLQAVNPSTVDDEKRRLTANLAVSSIKEVLDSLPESIFEKIDVNSFVLDIFDKTVTPNFGVSLRDYEKTSVDGVEPVNARRKHSLVVSKSSVVEKVLGARLAERMAEFGYEDEDGAKLRSVSSDSKDTKTTTLSYRKVLATPDWYDNVYLKVDVIPAVSFLKENPLDAYSGLTPLGSRSIMLDKVCSTISEVSSSALVALSKQDIFSIGQAFELEDGSIFLPEEEDVLKAVVLKARGDSAINVNRFFHIKKK